MRLLQLSRHIQFGSQYRRLGNSLWLGGFIYGLMEALAIVGIAAEWGAAQSYTAQTTGLATSTTTASLSAIADAATRSQPWVAQDPLLETSLPVSREDFYVTSDPGVQIFVREVLPVEQETTGHPILLIHGGGSAGLSNFDLDVPGYSLAATLAQAGHAAYILDVRGFGRSTRPASFDQPVAEVPPAVSIEVAVRDIQAVVEWIEHATTVLLLPYWAGLQAVIGLACTQLSITIR
ncbi:MAG: alpha/beta fold hydrolase [Cyanobacteria bacterium P01_F01_bin.86]